MAIHEKSLIRPENLKVNDNVVIDGINVSGHWSTFIESRVVRDYNESMQDEIAALPGGEYIHRCWQCGSCTNACTVNAINPDFNPRYWIYLIRMGMEAELLRDKDIIWQCVSCNKCTNICPRDVVPEAVMHATQHWLELKGHTEIKPSTHFDEVFHEQIMATGKIEEGRTIRRLFARLNMPLAQDWLIEMGMRLAKKLPIRMFVRMGFESVFAPRTAKWAPVGAAIEEYVHEREAANRKAVGLDKLVEMAKAEVTQMRQAAE